MARASRLAVLLLIAVTSPTYTLKADVTIGGIRPTILHVPASYDPQVPAPLLLLLHGCPSDAAGPFGENVFKMWPAAEERGILFAAPDGTGSPGQRSWGACSGSFEVSSAYLRSLIEEAQGLFNVDPSRVFIVGYSDGGIMAYRMAVDHPDLVSAIACLSGIIAAGWIPTVPVPVLDVHGTADANLPYSDGVRSIEVFVASSAWALPAVEAGRGPDIVSGVQTAVRRWGLGCLPDGFLELWTLPGVTHFPSLIVDGSTTALSGHMIDWLLKHARGPAPTASTIVIPTSGPAPLEVTADGSGSTSPAGAAIRSHCWSFGGGGAETGSVVQHTFAVPGRRIVRHLVVDDAGAVSRRDEQAVTIAGGSGNIEPWSATDIGGGTYPGSVGPEGDPPSGGLVICSAGAWPVSGRDQLFFVHRQIDGDFRLTVRVSEILTDGAGGFVGAMCREGLNDTSRFFGTILQVAGTPASPAGTFRLRYRSEEAKAVRGGSAGGASPPGGWVRIERRGNTFAGETSLDGITWSSAGSAALEGASTSMFLGVAAGRSSTTAAEFDALRAQVHPVIEDVPVMFLRGDFNDDGEMNIADAIAILGWLFLNEPPELACRKSADVNDSGEIDISDAISLLGFEFLGGQAPPEPYPSCGTDASPDKLWCVSSASCLDTAP
jgi:polyhydroxybutyrate depolymerase